MTGRHGFGRGSLAPVAAALVLALVQAVLLARTAWDKSDTADETRYVCSAASLAAAGTYRDLCEAPVLPKWGFAVGLELAGIEVAPTSAGWQAAMADLLAGKPAEVLRRTFFAARTATIAVVVLGGLLLWRAASRFGPLAGLVAHALWSFSPTVLANGSLAALDAWSAAVMCAVLLAAVRLVERPAVARAGLLGAACGAVAATKATALLVLPVGAVLAAVAVRRAPDRAAAARRSAALAAVVCGAAFATLWALYGFTVGGVDATDPCPFLVTAQTAPPGAWPAPAWIEGLVFQLRHAREGHANYLFGETSSVGWWWFYLACLALKLTVGVQAMTLLRVAADVRLARRGEPTRAATNVALLAFPAALLALTSAGRHQPNVAFLLPAFPFAITWLAAGVRPVARAFGRAGRALFLALLAVAIGESLRVHPHHLMFYNAWAGGPAGGPRYLVQREDWGQDKRRLAGWQRRHGVERIFYAPYGPHAAEWGIVWDPVPCTPTEGVYALHAVEVHRPRFALAPGCIDWLTVEPPDARIGHSIYVYRVDRARLDRLAAKRRVGAAPFWRSGPRDG